MLEDMPGFDNSNKEDVDILKIIADWLKSTYVVLVVNPQHFCLDVISADMRRTFCSAASSIFIEYQKPIMHLHIFEELCGKRC